MYLKWGWNVIKMVWQANTRTILLLCSHNLYIEVTSNHVLTHINKDCMRGHVNPGSMGGAQPYRLSIKGIGKKANMFMSASNNKESLWYINMHCSLLFTDDVWLQLLLSTVMSFCSNFECNFGEQTFSLYFPVLVLLSKLELFL